MIVFEDPPDPPRQWGCYNGPDKEEYLIVQDGYIYTPDLDGMGGTRVPRYKKIKDTSTHGCHTGSVAECMGCRHLPSALVRQGLV